MRDMTEHLNNVLSRAAHDTGATFIDIEDVLKGGQLCDGSEYVSGLYSLSLSNLYDRHLNEMFHPNAAGHKKMAEAIAQEIPSISTSMQSSVRPNAKSSEEYLSAPLTRQFPVTDPVLGPNTAYPLRAPQFQFQPNSPIRATVFSNPVLLGDFTADDDGGLDAIFTLPDSVPPGHHTLVIEGVTYSGEPMTLYQFITVSSGMPNDLDGDGIPDDEDLCDFIPEWIDEATGTDICKPSEEERVQSETSPPINNTRPPRDNRSTNKFTQANQLAQQHWHTSNEWRRAPFDPRSDISNPSEHSLPDETNVIDTKNTTDKADHGILLAISLVGVLVLLILVTSIIRNSTKRHNHKRGGNS